MGQGRNAAQRPATWHPDPLLAAPGPSAGHHRLRPRYRVWVWETRAMAQNL